VVGNKFKGVSGNAFAFLETLLFLLKVNTFNKNHSRQGRIQKKVKPEM
jgi:hypothetical protein